MRILRERHPSPSKQDTAHPRPRYPLPVIPAFQFASQLSAVPMGWLAGDMIAANLNLARESARRQVEDVMAVPGVAR